MFWFGCLAVIIHLNHIYYNMRFVYCCELAPGTIILQVAGPVAMTVNSTGTIPCCNQLSSSCT